MALLYKAKQKMHAAQMKADLKEATVTKLEAQIERLRMEAARWRMNSDLRKTEDDRESARAEVSELQEALQCALQRDSAKAEANELLREELNAVRYQADKVKDVTSHARSAEETNER
eukprot:7360264-Prymnesium_polylepis.1